MRFTLLDTLCFTIFWTAESVVILMVGDVQVCGAGTLTGATGGRNPRMGLGVCRPNRDCDGEARNLR